jgi:hypothetical protein
LMLGLALGTLGATGSVLALSVNRQAHTQVVGSAEELAQNMVSLTARRDLSADEVGGGLSKISVADLDGDVRQLGTTELLGLEIWSREGTQLYQRGLAGPLVPSDPSFARAATGSTVVRFLPKTSASPAAIEVLVPLGARRGDERRSVASVVLPADWVVRSANWATGQMLAAMAVILVLVAAGLLLLQLQSTTP